MDIDVDFSNRTRALELFKHIPASRVDNGTLVKHNTGVYFHPVPIFAEKNISAIPHTQGEEHGYFKVDFLNVGIYNNVRNEAHLIALMNKDPIWELLEQDEFSNMLFHINGYGDVLRQMKPKSIEQLAAVLAVIRPAKRHLVGKDWTTVNKEVWNINSNDGYAFKRSHATAYATAIVVQMNAICESII